MTKELDAQKLKIQTLYAELNVLKSKRARKSKKYLDLEAAIKAETERFNAMLVALDLKKE